MTQQAFENRASRRLVTENIAFCKSSVILKSFNGNSTSTSVRPVTPGEWQVTGEVRMVRHTTQTTVTEIIFPENLLRPDRFTALFHMNVYLPKGRLYSLMAVYSTTLKSTFIASKFCKLLLL